MQYRDPAARLKPRPFKATRRIKFLIAMIDDNRENEEI
jgi:hypothetical protein